MLTKLLIIAGAALFAWGVLRNAFTGGAKPEARFRAEDFARCPDCGAWRPKDEDCACRQPPIP